MIGGITIKVCGITRAADAAMLRAYGADFLGVNVEAVDGSVFCGHHCGWTVHNPAFLVHK